MAEKGGPPVVLSRTGAPILTKGDAAYSYVPRKMFSGEPRRLTMAEFKESMPALPINSDLVSLVLSIDKAVMSMKDLVEPYDALDYYACRTCRTCALRHKDTFFKGRIM